MDSYYSELIERLKKETYWCGSSEAYSREIHPLICDEAASAIGELLSNLKAAEADNKRWKQICETQNERIDEREKRAERAEDAIAEIKRARDFTRPAYVVDKTLEDFYNSAAAEAALKGKPVTNQIL